MHQKDLLCNYFHHAVHAVMFYDSEELLMNSLLVFQTRRKKDNNIYKCVVRGAIWANNDGNNIKWLFVVVV